MLNSMIKILTDVFKKKESLRLGEREKLEIEKLKIEMHLAEKQLSSFSANRGLEIFKTIAPFITSLVTLIGIFIAFSYQQIQLTDLKSQHLDDVVFKDINQLVISNSEPAKIISISRLSIYLQDSITYEKYRRNIIDLLVNYAEEENSSNVKSFIQKTLSNYGGDLAINALIYRNREIANGIKAYFDEGNRNDTIPPPDSIKITWNIGTLLECIQKKGKLENVDLSDLMLEFYSFNYNEKLDVNSTTGYFSSNIISTEHHLHYLENVNFLNVKFINCIIPLEFRRCNFNSVEFRNSNLMFAKFKECKFKDGGFFNISWDPELSKKPKIYELYEPEAHYYEAIDSYHPKWENSVLQLSNFSISNQHKADTFEEFLFSNSIWRIQNRINDTGAFYHLTNNSTSI